MNFKSTKNKVLIELCTSDDFERIADIYNEYIKLGSATMEETLYSKQRIKEWVEHFSDKEKIYVIREGKKVLGWGIIKRYSQREGYRFAGETAIYITQSELRKGYGSMMKKLLIDQCKAMGYRHLVAKIFASNIASIQYNLKIGYTIVGKQKEIGFRNGEWQDIVIMQYLIKE